MSLMETFCYNLGYVIFSHFLNVWKKMHRIKSQRTPINVDILNDQVIKEIKYITQINKGYIHSHEYALSSTQKQQ